MADPRLLRILALACHDLRTPLATVSGFAKTLTRLGGLDEPQAHFVETIDAAAEEMALLIDDLGVLARIESGTWDPVLAPADTVELATSSNPRVETNGEGVVIETAAPALSRALAALALAAARHGEVERVSWTVNGREFALEPVNAAAAPVVTGQELRDLGAAIAWRVVEALGGSLALDGETLFVRL